MRANSIDLHVHSNCSDGTYTPAQLVEYALQKHLKAFALTDHDTVSGLSQAFSAARGTALEVVSGIEFSTRYRGREIHIVGLDFDARNPLFLDQLSRFRDSRKTRNEKMIRKMQEDGIEISLEQMREEFKDCVLTRAHFARYLAGHGYVSDMTEAFLRLIGEGCKYYVPREKVSPVQAVRLIREANGIPVLAHPMLYRLPDEEMAELINDLKTAGLIGIEAIYSTHSAREESLVRRLAKQYDLLISGGSDFHGANKPLIDLGCGRGNLDIPYFILKNMRDRRNT